MAAVVKASVWHDPDTDRWYTDIDVPNTRSPERSCRRPGPLIEWLDKWGKDRGVFVDVNFLTNIGGHHE